MADHLKNREVMALYEISKVLTFSNDTQRAFATTLGILSNFLGLQLCAIVLMDQVTGDLFLEAAPEVEEERRASCRFKRDQGVLGHVFNTGMTFAAEWDGQNSLLKDFLARLGWSQGGKGAFLALPVLHAKKTWGVLACLLPLRQTPLGNPMVKEVLSVTTHLLGWRIAHMEEASSNRMEELEERNPHPSQPMVFPGVVGKSLAMRDIMESIRRVAPSRATVMLRGPSGTGKELMARTIHECSPRANRPFVAVNCAALPETLLESELFGHEKGAFTGANQQRLGRVEMANGGTLFLDEIGDLTLSAQVKLLRLLEEWKVERLGGSSPIPVDVRLVSATNRDLEADIRQGTFRFDLYHRLSVVPLHLPPLKNRPEDIPLLTGYYLQQFNQQNNTSVSLTPDAVERLQSCGWSGNVRQLRNCLERIVVSTQTPLVTAQNLPCGLCRLEEALGIPAASQPAASQPAASQPAAYHPPPAGAQPPFGQAAEGADYPPGANWMAQSEKVEREQVLKALEQCGWVQAKAARLLGMTPRQIKYRIEKLAIPLKKL